MTFLHSGLGIREFLWDLLHGRRQKFRQSLGLQGEFTGFSKNRYTNDSCQAVSIWEITG
jgi:hypothetical protein